MATAANFEDTTGGDGRTGYNNLGNTCYMSATLQCMQHTDKFRHYLITEAIEDMMFWDESEPKLIYKRMVTFYYGILVRQWWSNKFSSLSYNTLKAYFGGLNEQFKGNAQNDASELLDCLLDCVNDTLKRWRIEALPGLPMDNIHAMAAFNWAKFESENDTIITDLFSHQMVQSRTCGKCTLITHNFVQNNVCSLAFPPNPPNNMTLDALLTISCTLEIMEGVSCSFCGERSDAEKYEKFWSLPQYLVFAMRRKSAAMIEGEYVEIKIETLVTFPLTGLDMSIYCHEDKNLTVNALYDCYAVVNHLGNFSGGHYTAFAKPSNDSKPVGWREFNDHRVTNIRAEEVVTMYATVLFYKRRSPPKRPPRRV